MKIERSQRNIICIDLKSFYACCECVARGLDPFTTKLAVVGRLDEPGSIILAASPGLRAAGAKSRCRAYELQAFKDVIYAPARMRHYLEVSKAIVSVYLRYISVEDLHVYSIDEAFLDVTGYLQLYKCDDVTLAKRIMSDIVKETGVPSTCGIGPNLLLAKLALDNEAKKAPDGVAKWTYEDVPTKLWPITPLAEVWGIGAKMETSLNKMGIYCVGDIAHYPLEFLVKRFGVLGEELYRHSHGIDESRINQAYQPQSTSIGGSQVLMRDYFAHDIKTVILEQVEEVMMRLRRKKKMCLCISLSIGYSKKVGGGFSRQTTFSQPTDLTDVVFEACMGLFYQHYNGSPIRKIGIHVTKLCSGDQVQLNLFEDVTKKQKLAHAMDDIRLKHGKASLLRAVSFSEEGTARYRSTLLGGHKA